MSLTTLPKGTPVRVVRGIHQSDPSIKVETIGVIESWGKEPTGAWYAHGRNGKLWLDQLRLRKSDGEISVLTLDEQTSIQPVSVPQE
jgi:hypothetical protein